ncbi:PAS domain S-box protein [uncultured Nostoc sp.]|uniref:PAS domain S-box protein n=1 Tax=uncultured Nostoc sp. TaxID=340711 RepID=UPI0035C988F2
MSISFIHDENGKLNHFIGIQTDISLRKLAEASLRRQALTFENMHDGVIITDLTGNIIDWNPAAESMFGYSKAEVLAKTPNILYKPEEAAVLTNKIFERLNQQGRWSGEIHFIRKDGSEGISETTIISLQDEQGETVATVGINHDITENKRVKEALQRQLHRTLLLEQITQEIRQSLDSRKIFETAATQIGKAFGVERCLIHSSISDPTPRIPLVAEYSTLSIPKMDGLEATRRIYQDWGVGFRPYIIAITANAMRGDREVCLAAGMHDYISKPIQLQELAEALSKCPPQKSSEFTSTGKQGKVMCLELQPSQNILQSGQNQTLKSVKINAKILQSLQNMLGGDRVAFVELIECYLTETPRLVQDISTAITTQDAQTLLNSAHQLKSSSASVGAMALAQLCKVLEAQGCNSKLENSLELISQLYQEYEQVKTALEKELAKELP